MTFQPYAPPEHGGGARPAVILFYRVYAAFVALGWLALMVSSAFFYASVRGTALFDPATGATIAGGAGEETVAIVLIATGAAGFLFYAFAAAVPFKPWGWTLALVAIALGALGLTIVVAIPLLLKWRSPLVKAAFRRLP